MLGRVYFNFSVPSERIKQMYGYVLCNWERDTNGDKIVKPVDVVLLKLVAVAPNWKRLRELAIENAI